MALLFDETAFVGEIKIDFGAFSDFDSFAQQIQDEYLKLLMGFELWYDYEQNITDAKYVTLNDGIPEGYDDNGTQRELKGIISMLPYFFYFRYQTDLQTFQSTLGDYQPLIENAGKPETKGTLVKKQVNAYNKGVAMYLQLVNYIQIEGETVYEGFNPTILDTENTYGI